MNVCSRYFFAAFSRIAVASACAAFCASAAVALPNSSASTWLCSASVNSWPARTTGKGFAAASWLLLLDHPKSLLSARRPTDDGYVDRAEDGLERVEPKWMWVKQDRSAMLITGQKTGSPSLPCRRLPLVSYPKTA